MAAVELGAIASALSSLTSLAKKVNESEIKSEMLDQIIDLQRRLLELQEELGKLRVENRDLRQELDVKEGFEFKGGLYWKDDEGPYCPHCTPQGNPVRLTHLNGRGWFCEVCRNSPVAER